VDDRIALLLDFMAELARHLLAQEQLSTQDALAGTLSGEQINTIAVQRGLSSCDADALCMVSLLESYGYKTRLERRRYRFSHRAFLERFAKATVSQTPAPPLLPTAVIAQNATPQLDASAPSWKRFERWWFKDSESERMQGGQGAIQKLYDEPGRLKPDAVKKQLLKPENIVRFKREIEISKHIDLSLTIFDWDRQGYQWYVMRYFSGGSLRDAINSAVSPDDAQKWSEQLAEQIDFINSKGVLHRDLKPDNIMLDGMSKVHIVDFGCAVLAAEVGHLTSDPDRIGTPTYMAPERGIGAHATIASEVYEFARTVAELLNAAGLTQQAQWLRQIGMHTDPSQRPASASELWKRVPKTFEVEKPPTKPSVYKAGEITLPFACFDLKILHDQVTAVVLGTQGQIAAIDLCTGNVLDSVEVEKEYSWQWSRLNVKVLIMFSLAWTKQCFHILTKEGIFLTWKFDKTLFCTSRVDLIKSNFNPLRAKIVKSHKKFDYSSMSAYSREVPVDEPDSLLDAKLSPDGAFLVCITDWFAVFRCDIGGRLKNSMAIVDACAIAPANSSGSEVWIRISRREASLLSRFDLDTGATLTYKNHIDFQSGAILVVSEDSLFVEDSVFTTTTPLTQVNISGFPVRQNKVPLILPTRRLLLSPSNSMVAIRSMESKQKIGPPLICGHQSSNQYSILSIDANVDGSYVVSLVEKSLRIWDTETREPVGGYPTKQRFLHHGLYGDYHLNNSATSDGCIYYRSRYEHVVVVINIRNRTQLQFSSTLNEIGCASDNSELSVFTLESAPAPPESGVLGRVKRYFNIQPEKHFFLKHQVIKDAVFVERALVRIDGPEPWYCEPLSNKSVALDLGYGHVALLTGGQIGLYDTKTRNIVCGLLDISGTAENMKNDLPCPKYSQLKASPDFTKLLLRGRDLKIKVFDASNLLEICEIENSAGEVGLLLAWIDSRHIIFSLEVNDANWLLIADGVTGKVVRDICKLSSYLSENTAAAVLGHGSAIALVDGDTNSVVVVDLVTGVKVAKPLVVHSDVIDAIYCVPDTNEVFSISKDGSARYTSFEGFFEDTVERANLVIGNIRS
jgi:serine/threonine protein kinase